MAKLKPKRFWVYVIRLDPAVLESKKFRDANPKRIKGADCYYVGMTGRTPQERLEQHKLGYKSCRFVEKHGLELMPGRVFSHCNPKTYDDAAAFERKVAAKLRRKGFAVWQR